MKSWGIIDIMFFGALRKSGAHNLLIIYLRFYSDHIINNYVTLNRDFREIGLKKK